MNKLHCYSVILLPVVLLFSFLHESSAFGVACVAPLQQITPTANLSGATKEISDTVSCNGLDYANTSVFKVTDQGKFTNLGTFATVLEGSVANRGVFANENKVVNLGPLRNESGAHFANSGTFANQGNGSVINESAGRVIDNKAVNGFVNSGTFTNQDSALFINKSGATFQNSGTFTQSNINTGSKNDGMFINKGDLNITPSGILFNENTLTNKGNVQVEGSIGSFSRNGVYQQIANAAEPSKEIATVLKGKTDIATVISQKLVDIQHGTLSGTGAIRVSEQVVNTGGVVSPGGDRPGILRIIPESVGPGQLVGGYSQGVNGRLDLKIGGLKAGSQYSVLSVFGPVSLRGSLFVSLVDGFVPQVGNKFNLITGSRIDVGLRQISLQRLPDGTDWLTSFAGGVFELTVRQVPLPGSGAPEPNTLLLAGFGFAWLVWRQWRKRQIQNATN